MPARWPAGANALALHRIADPAGVCPRDAVECGSSDLCGRRRTPPVRGRCSSPSSIGGLRGGRHNRWPTWL